jgi:8-oxo-dGTP pyrophosphatase MutT (NUDIX family)
MPQNPTPNPTSTPTWIPDGPNADETILDSPVMRFLKRRCRNSSDAERKYTFYLLQSRDWCNVIPVTEDGKVVLVRQYRAGTDSKTLEIPGGVVDPGDADVAATALRELAEETGYTLVPGGKVTALGAAHPNPAIQNNRVHSFIAGPVRKTLTPAPDPGELLEIIEVPLAEIPALITGGAITHSLILNAFFGLMQNSSTFATDLVRQIQGWGLPTA